MKNHSALAILVLIFGAVVIGTSFFISLLFSVSTTPPVSATRDVRYAMSFEQCLDSEVFNEEYEICNPDCSKDLCLELNSGVQKHAAAIRKLTSRLSAKEPVSNVRTLAVYGLEGKSFSSATKNETLPGLEDMRDDIGLHREIWRNVIELIPPVYQKDLAELQMVTDGAGAMTYELQRYDKDPLRFVVRIDIDDWSNNGNIVTNQLKADVVRLVAGLSSRSRLQMHDQDVQDCSGESVVLEDNFCVGADSYLNRFNSTFWDNSDYSTGLLGAKDSKDYYQNRADEYFKFKQEFYNPYALSSLQDDYAESFLEFVLLPEPDVAVTDSQKSEFFYQFEELVVLREYLRSRINQT